MRPNTRSPLNRAILAKYIAFATSNQDRKAYARWLEQGTEQSRWKAADLETIAPLIEDFHKARALLAPAQRDIFKFPSVAALFSVVEPILRARGDSAALARWTEAANTTKDALTLFESHGLKAFIPLSQAAAIRYGSGTNWCVSKPDNNAYWYFVLSGPLIMIFDARGHKGKVEKFCLAPGSGQFRDATDTEIGCTGILEKFPELAKALLPYIPLKHTPPNYVTRENALKQLSEDGNNLQLVPKNLIDEEMCWTAVRRTPGATAYVPEALLSAELRRHGILGSVHIFHRNKNVILDRLTYCLAVNRYERAAEAICPKAFSAMPSLALRCVRRNGTAAEYFPPDIWTLKRGPLIALTAVAQNGTTAEYLPLALWRSEICQRLAFTVARQAGNVETPQYNSRAVKHIPSFVWKLPFAVRLAFNAVRHNGFAAKHLPPSIWKSKWAPIIALAAVRSQGEAVQYIPAHVWKTKLGRQIALSAVSQDRNALKHLPLRLFIPAHVKEIAITAVTQDGLAAEHITNEMWNAPYGQDIADAAVANNSMALEYIPLARRKVDSNLRAIDRDYKCVRFLVAQTGKEIPVQRYIDHAFSISHEACRHIPVGYWPKGLKEELVKEFPDMLGVIPLEEQTFGMCLAAFSHTFYGGPHTRDDFFAAHPTTFIASAAQTLATQARPEEGTTTLSAVQCLLRFVCDYKSPLRVNFDPIMQEILGIGFNEAGYARVLPLTSPKRGEPLTQLLRQAYQTPHRS